MNKFEVLEVLGEGTYGIVVKALQKDNNEIVAIKKFKDNAKNFIRRELKMLNSLKSCEFVINLKEAYKRKEKVYFIFEYVERSLLNLLQQYPQGISQNICKNLLFQLCKAIEKCHSLEIIHRDIKPENLLIDGNYHLKLCDFGFARQTTDHPDKPLTEYVATRWYRAPELLLFCPYSKPVDVWAIGCIVCEMSNGRPLFAGSSDLDQIHKILSLIGPLPENMEELKRNGKYNNFKFQYSKYDKNLTFDKKFGEIMSEKMLDFTKGCLTLNPKSRLVISECLMHPALELQLKSFVSKKIGKEITTVSSMRLRDRQKIDGRESRLDRNRKALSLNEHQIFHPPISRLSINGETNDSNDDIFLSDKIISSHNIPNISSHNISNITHEPVKPKIIESRIKTTQYYQSDDDLNEKRLNDENLNNLMINKVCMPSTASYSSISRKQSVLGRNKDDSNFGVYETTDIDRSRSNNSTLSTYGNIRYALEPTNKNDFSNNFKTNEITNNYIKLLKNRNDPNLSIKRSKSTIDKSVEMIDFKNNRKIQDNQNVNKSNNSISKNSNQYLLHLQNINKLEISNLSNSVADNLLIRNSNDLFKSPRTLSTNIKKTNSQVSHQRRENFLF